MDVSSLCQSRSRKRLRNPIVSVGAREEWSGWVGLYGRPRGGHLWGLPPPWSIPPLVWSATARLRSALSVLSGWHCALPPYAVCRETHCHYPDQLANEGRSYWQRRRT